MLEILMIVQVVLIFISLYHITKSWAYHKKIAKVYEESVDAKRCIEIHEIKIRLIRQSLERKERVK